MKMRLPSKIEQAIYEIEHSPAGYRVQREGQVLVIAHPSFSQPLRVSAGKLRPSSIVAALEAYRQAIGDTRHGRD
jgi:hypothetical protein